ncbi:copper amine oxidase N-terminal domain-containing protein [Abyssisolibacter fermentans]|uniref:copper amine oxidase N-terminal domain-containing protein n=1 Tax=Abyssisolibacter fermentans TaxID=1766203 RepID=UPI000832A48A|nr:copper amine oxidase N-terminal domain-containing protein [Abyssisolibacter fermentans]
MKRLNKTLISFLVITLCFVVSTSVIYGEGCNKKEDQININNICYDDENYVYFEIGKQMARLKKDFSGEFEILTEKEQNEIELLKNKEKCFEIEGEEIDSQYIEIKDNILYYNGLKLLDIKKYIDEDNQFYKEHTDVERKPIINYLYKYILDDKRILYIVKTKTCLAISAPYTPSYSDYVIVNEDNIQGISIEKDFDLDKILTNNNGILMVGYKEIHPMMHNSKIYYVDTDKYIAHDLIENVEDEWVMLQEEVGINNDLFVFFVTQKGKESDKKINGFYNVNADKKIIKRKEDISIINEKYTNEYHNYYLSRDDEIYYISDNVNGVVNLTKGTFKEFKMYAQIKIDDEYVRFNDELGHPFIDENNRMQVPFRATLEKFEATVKWDNDLLTAVAIKDDITVEVPINKKYILKNGEKIENDTNAVIKNERTYLPIRAVMEAFGCEVSFDSETDTAIINTK